VRRVVRGGPEAGTSVAGTPDAAGGEPEPAASGEEDPALGPPGGGGHEECDAGEGTLGPAPEAWVAPGVVRARLYSRQQVGQRHSSTMAPSGPLKRVSRQPNCALMSV
jgi:hypothetical protein